MNTIHVDSSGGKLLIQVARLLVDYGCSANAAGFAVYQSNIHLLDIHVEVDAATQRPALYLRLKDDMEGEPTAAFWLDTGEMHDPRRV